MRVRRGSWRLAGALITALALVEGTAGVTVAARTDSPTIGPIATVSAGCGSSQNAEVQQAVDATSGAPQGLVYVYEDWMGCGGISFARSTDGGRTFGPPETLPGSSGSSVSTTWDPAIAVGPDGAVYAVFMVAKSSSYYPVVARSVDHGVSFTQVTPLLPPQNRNWGDRPFVAVDPANPNVLYVTWDYGPSRASISYICPSGGSCAFAAGDLNAVVQRSTDGGKTFGPIVPINPGFPAGGGDSAPVLVDGTGRVDVLYQGYQVIDPTTYALGPATQYFTSSTDGGMTWSSPVPVGASAGTMSLAEWWIDGSLAADTAGNLYAAWDTQDGTNDVGWISFSTDHGQTWSAPNRATPDVDNAPHITQVTGGSSGRAYVGVLSDASPQGYALTLRPFAIQGATGAWLSAPVQVSSQYGDPTVWPGDTFGLSTISATASSASLVGSWGSAVPGNKKSQVFAATIGY